MNGFGTWKASRPHFLLLLGYFGMWWPFLLGYLALQVVVGDHDELPQVFLQDYSTQVLGLKRCRREFNCRESQVALNDRPL